MGLLRLITAGSVDAGKSTLIGRLLFESDNIYKDQLDELKRWSENKSAAIDLSQLTDGLKAEREKGITIDVAYKYFSTSKRKFIIADSPGHVEYTRNMITAASNTDLVIILVDAVKGIVEQTKRHTYIASLLRIPNLVVCINKIDEVNFSEEVYNNIRQSFLEFTHDLEFDNITFIPVSALSGCNIVSKGNDCPWYAGEHLLAHLENIKVNKREEEKGRIVIQHSLQDSLYAAKVLSGSFKKGETIFISSLSQTSQLNSIRLREKEFETIIAPQSISIKLKSQVNLERGTILCSETFTIDPVKSFNATVCWMDSEDLNTTKEYLLMLNCLTVSCTISKVFHKIDINTLSNMNDQSVRMNDIAFVKINSSDDLFVESYSKNTVLGRFALVDKTSNNTVAAGMIE